MAINFKKEEEKAKVGRPKLAEPELIKDSWCRIASCSVIAVVMVICMVGLITERTPLQVMTFKEIGVDTYQASVGNITNDEDTNESISKDENVRVIPAKKAETYFINADGEMYKVIYPTRD